MLLGSPVPAGYDRLTGLPDRTGFAARTRDVLGATPSHALVGLCYLDLGPTALPAPATVAVARRLSDLAGEDGVLARVADAGFALLIAGAHLLPGAVAELGGQVWQALAPPFPAGGPEVTGSARVSVVERMAGETTHEDLMDAADRGMRHAGVRHRACWMAVDLDRACALVRMR